MPCEIHLLSAREQSAAIQAGTFSAAEVIEAHLTRIDSVNGPLNALPEVWADDARTAARAADEAMASGAPLGPLHGVPFTVKDCFDVAGKPTAFGVTALKENIADRDAPVVAALRRAGAIPIGRGNMPDYGLFWKTISSLHGETLNPWNSTRTAGGSSGGDAVAVATGMAPLGLGGDMGGSLRVPAQCCGIAALKPSRGRVSRTMTRTIDAAPYFYEQVAMAPGPMARSVADLRLALSALEAPDPEDPEWTPAQTFPDAGPVRVAFCPDIRGVGIDPDVAAGLHRAADVLSNAGYAVEDATPPMAADAKAAVDTICAADLGRFRTSMEREISDEARAILNNGLIPSDIPSLDAYMDAIAKRHAIARAWGAFLERYPLVLGPVSTFNPFERDYLTQSGAVERYLNSIALTEIGNLLGLPCLAVPVGIANGLPQSAQLLAGRFREDRVLQAAEAIEATIGPLTPICHPRESGDDEGRWVSPLPFRRRRHRCGGPFR